MSAYDWLASRDRIFLEVEDSHSPMHVAGCFVFEAGPLSRQGRGIDFERICDYVESRLSDIPRYRQRLESLRLDGRPIWVDDPDFNLHYHLRHTRLPLPGDERQLKRLCGRIISQQLDRGKPLWELWVVEGIEGDRCALISKVHHCMVDGVAGVELLQALLRPMPDETIEPIRHWTPRRTPKQSELLMDLAARAFRAPLDLSLDVLKIVRDPVLSIERAIELGKGLWHASRFESHQASSTPLDGAGGPHRRLDWCRVDRDDVDEIRRSQGGTVNDVAIAATTAAIARYFVEQGISRAELREMDFRIACPVNMRRHVETRGRARNGLSGNRVSLMFAQLPLAESDPLKRYARVRDALAEAKESHVASALEQVVELTEWLPSAAGRAMARAEMSRRTANLVLTNVPGPPAPLFLLEARMLECYPVVPLMPGQAMGIALFSYDGALYFGFNADWEALPDLHDLAVALVASFGELREAVRSCEEGKQTGSASPDSSPRTASRSLP